MLRIVGRSSSETYFNVSAATGAVSPAIYPPMARRYPAFKQVIPRPMSGKPTNAHQNFVGGLKLPMVEKKSINPMAVKIAPNGRIINPITRKVLRMPTFRFSYAGSRFVPSSLIPYFLIGVPGDDLGCGLAVCGFSGILFLANGFIERSVWRWKNTTGRRTGVKPDSDRGIAEPSHAQGYS